MVKTAKKKLKIGFDFDGVLAYNPVRIFRLPVSFLSRLLLGKGGLSYLSYYPKTGLEKFFWKSLHWTSFFPAFGFSELKKLLVEEKIEGYIISGRFAILEDSLEKWLAKHGAENLFADCFVNKNNEPPHFFKERMLKKLGLDIYVEDNWDIVNYLNSKFQAGKKMVRLFNGSMVKKQPLSHRATRLPARQVEPSNHPEIHWIYNILDRWKPYQNKHPYLKKFLESLNRLY